MKPVFKSFLCGCVNGLIFIAAVAMFVLGVYSAFSALEYHTWYYIVGFIVYIVFLFGLAGTVN